MDNNGDAPNNAMQCNVELTISIYFDVIYWFGIQVDMDSVL